MGVLRDRKKICSLSGKLVNFEQTRKCVIKIRDQTQAMSR